MFVTSTGNQKLVCTLRTKTLYLTTNRNMAEGAFHRVLELEAFNMMNDDIHAASSTSSKVQDNTWTCVDIVSYLKTANVPRKITYLLKCMHY